MNRFLEMLSTLRLGDRGASLIRTGVPIAVGSGAAWLAQRTGYPGVVPDLGPFAAWVAGFGYYAGVRELERRWPKFGILLGVPAQPAYERR